MTYEKALWLNNDRSASLGSVVAFDGECLNDGKPYRDTFLSISDW